jgi:site-specific DNA-methyltransferase (adenine-specific)
MNYAMKITDKINLHHIDCMDFMRNIPDGYYELAIVDPPYGIGFDNKIREAKTKKWDNETPSKEYFDELFRVSKNQIIWGANYFPYLWQNGCKGFVFWNKDVNFDSYSAGELAYTSFDRPAKYFYYAWNGLADGIRGRNKQQKTIHPTQKPVALYKYLLDKYAKPNDKILDTHGGSMSIAIACHDYGFDLDLCELDKEYFDKGVQRVKNHVAQQKLF